MYTYIIYRYNADVKVFLSEKRQIDYTVRYETTSILQTLYRTQKSDTSLLSLSPMTDSI